MAVNDGNKAGGKVMGAAKLVGRATARVVLMRLIGGAIGLVAVGGYLFVKELAGGSSSDDRGTIVDAEKQQMQDYFTDLFQKKGIDVKNRKVISYLDAYAGCISKKALDGFSESEIHFYVASIASNAPDSDREPLDKRIANNERAAGTDYCSKKVAQPDNFPMAND